MKKTITGHIIVRNEDRWIWYSIKSIIDFVDKLIIFDTGSIDQTCDIIQLFTTDEKYKNKIIFEKKGVILSIDFYKLRQEQIDRTTTDYFFVVDGDEIWYKETLQSVQYLINKSAPDLLAIRFVNCAGDIFHYRDASREKYSIGDVIGNVTIRIYSRHIPGIRCAGKYGVEGYYDCYNKFVQDSKWNIKLIDGFYLHMSMLQRSSVRKGDLSIRYRWKKFKADWDHKFVENFKYPEVFYMKRENIVYDPWKYKIGITDYMYCGVRKLLRCIKKFTNKL